jgi:hypothetical protein
VTTAAATLTTTSAATTASTTDDATAATAVTAAATAATATATAATAAAAALTAANADVVVATSYDAAIIVHAAAVVTYDEAVVTAAASNAAAATAATTVTTVVLATASVTAATTAVADATEVTTAATAVTTAAGTLTTTSAATTASTTDDATAATAVTAAATAATATATAATAAAAVKTTADAALTAANADVVAATSYDAAIIVHAAAVATYDAAVVTAAASKTTAATAATTVTTVSLSTASVAAATAAVTDATAVTTAAAAVTAAAATLTSSSAATTSTTDNTSAAAAVTAAAAAATATATAATEAATVKTTADAALVTANAAAITLSLTTSVDTYVGGVGDDTFTATLLTLGAGDSVIDSTTADNDTLTVITNTNIASTTTITKVENINVQSLGATSVDMANISSVNVFGMVDSTGAITVNNADNAAMVLSLSGQFNNTITVNYDAGTLNGSDNNIAMTATSAKNVTVDVDSGFERATLTLKGSANTVSSITVPGASLTIAGTGDATFAANALVNIDSYTIANTAALKFGAIQTTDVSSLTATANTSGISGSTALVSGNIYSTDTIDGATTGLALLLGSGADNVLINEQAGAGKTNTIKLGGGNDIADINNAGDGATYIFGEAGNDTMRVKTVALETTDLISGGTGTDTLVLTGNLVNNLVLLDVENVYLDGTTGAKTSLSSSDVGVVFTTQAVADDCVNLAGLTAGSTVIVNANSSTTAADAEVSTIDVEFTAAEAATTFDINTAQDGHITASNITALTLDFAEIVGGSTQGDIDVTAGKSLAITAAKDITFGDLLAGSELLTSLTVTASGKVTINDLLNDAVLATVSITASDNIDVGKIEDADKLTSLTLTSSSGSVILDELGDNLGSVTDADNLATLSLSGGTWVTAGVIEADIIGNVTMTATSGLLTVTGITSAAAMGTVALTATAGGVKVDTGDIVAADTTGITANITATTFINVTGLTDGAKADVINTKGDIASTLAGAAAAAIDYTAGTINNSASSGSVTLTASNTGGLVTRITNNELVGVGVSTVTLSALSGSTENSVTLLGYSATTSVTGSIGADTIVNSSGGALLATESTNSNDTYTLAGGTDTLSYFDNTHGAASGTASVGAVSNGYAMNFTAATISFDNSAVASATNITTLAVGKVAQYDSTAVSSVATTAGNIVAGGETDTVSGVETVIGSGLNDYIAASSTGMTITGGAGVDTIIAGAGVDNIVLNQTAAPNDINVIGFATDTDKLVVSVALFDAAAGSTPLATLGGAGTAIGVEFTSVANAAALGGNSVGAATNAAMFLHLQNTGAIYFNHDADTEGGLTLIGSIGAASTLVDSDWTLVA